MPDGRREFARNWHTETNRVARRILISVTVEGGVEQTALLATHSTAGRPKNGR
jgi:hypothetical protein